MKSILRKVCALFLCLVFSIGLVPVSFAAEDAAALSVQKSDSFDAARGVLINASNFPDPAFRRFVAEHCDPDGDLVLTDEEIGAVTDMDIHGLGIKDLSGIWEFWNLVTLNCSENLLRFLDVSDLPDLEKLYCQNNFSVGGESQDAGHLGLETLIPNRALKVLWCYGNNLSAAGLELSLCSGLEDLNCSWNPLGYLDLSAVPHLKELRCNSTGLAALDLSPVPELCVLWCWNGNAIHIPYFDAAPSNNSFERLDLSFCPLLSDVVANGIREDYYTNVAFFDGESEVSVSTTLPLTLYLGNEHGDFVVENQSQYPLDIISDTSDKLVEITAEHFPDEAFREALLSYDWDGDGWINGYDYSVRYLSISNLGIASLDGIEYFPDLVSLDVSGNELTELNLSHNPGLSSLNCENNHLMQLDLSANPALVNLNCSNNLIGQNNLIFSDNAKLTSLTCGGNPLLALDVSALKELTSLSCIKAQLSSLDIRSNAKLSSLDCGSNMLRTLDLRNVNLTSLDCRFNWLENLDIRHFDKLVHLDCRHNRLQSLDISHSDALEYLSCGYNRLQSLELFPSVDFRYLSCEHNSISVLDIGSCRKLVAAVDNGTVTEEDGVRSYNWNVADLFFLEGWGSGSAQLYVDSSTTLLLSAPVAIGEAAFPDAAFREYVSGFDLDNDGRLSALECYRVEAIDCSGKEIASLRGLEHFTNLGVLDCSGNALTELKLYPFPRLVELVIKSPAHSSGTATSYADLNYSLKYDTGVQLILIEDALAIDELHFPDASFRRYIEEHFDLDHDQTLSVAEQESVTKLDVSERGITDLSGLDFFVNLTELNCSWNKLSRLDVSALAHLETLYCQNNYIFNVPSVEPSAGELVTSDSTIYDAPVTSAGITELVIGSAPLKTLWCYDNLLTRLDLSECRSLENLDCAFNNLESLDVSGQSALTVLMCHDNDLTALDISANPSLTTLWCWNNRIDTLDISRCPKLISATVYASVENLQDHVSLFNNEAEVSLSYSTELIRGGELDTGVPVTLENFPDENFRSLIRYTVDLNHDGVLSEHEISALEELNCTSQEIGSLEGIQYLTGLKRLYCANNRLTSLDVSALTGLEELICSYNRLTDLNISNNHELKRLRCFSNRLTALNLSDNEKLRVLWCFFNDIEKLDVSASPVLSMLAMYGIAENYEGAVGYTDDDGEFHQTGTHPFTSYFDKSETGDLSVDDSVALTTEFYLRLEKEIIPDDAFRTYLGEFDHSGDGLLSQHEIDGVKEINCAGLGIESLQGLEFFPALTVLNCRGNQLTKLDISANPALVSLECAGNRLSSLDTSCNPALTYVDCADNCLTQLILSNNYLLQTLDCTRNVLNIINLIDCDTLAQFLQSGAQPFVADGIAAYSGTFTRDDGEYCKVSLRHDADALLWTEAAPKADFVLPADLLQIGAEAFRGCAYIGVKLPDTLLSIGSRAFAYSPNLRWISIPAGVTEIADDAFDGVGALLIFGKSNLAEAYARSHGFAYQAE